MESMGYGCGRKEVYRLPHTIYPYVLLLYLFFFAAASLLFVHFFKVFRSCSSTFLYLNFMYEINFSRSINTYGRLQATTGVPRQQYEGLHIMF